MSDVFLSYAREDQTTVRHVAECLAKEGYDVFWDRRILEGHHFAQVIEQNLAEARCVVVFWSKHSAQSRWVKAEAAWGDEKGALLEVRLDTTKPPLPFGRTQILQLRRRSGSRSSKPCKKLATAVQRIISPQMGIGELDPPQRGFPISEDHIVIIHASKRAPEYDNEWDEDIYLFEVIVYGHKRVLDLVERVTWYLHPYYDKYSQSIVVRDRRSRSNCFRHRELAWGDSVIRANVKIAGQVELVQLSRYIDLTDNREPLKGFYY